MRKDFGKGVIIVTNDGWGKRALRGAAVCKENAGALKEVSL